MKPFVFTLLSFSIIQQKMRWFLYIGLSRTSAHCRKALMKAACFPFLFKKT